MLKEIDSKDELEERVEYLEEISKVKVLRSCEELSLHGITKNGNKILIKYSYNILMHRALTNF